MTEIAIWVIVILLGAIVYIVWHGLKIARDQHQSTMAALSSLGDTQPWEIASICADWWSGADSNRWPSRAQ